MGNRPLSGCSPCRALRPLSAWRNAIGCSSFGTSSQTGHASNWQDGSTGQANSSQRQQRHSQRIRPGRRTSCPRGEQTGRQQSKARSQAATAMAAAAMAGHGAGLSAAGTTAVLSADRRSPRLWNVVDTAKTAGSGSHSAACTTSGSRQSKGTGKAHRRQAAAAAGPQDARKHGSRPASWTISAAGR